jgi:hypothetical protein
MIYALLYISDSMVEGAASADAVTRIVEVSRPRNARLAVTGALIFAESHFAQMLEGPQAAVEELMASIRRDPRHRNVRVLREGPVPERRFTRWSLAYYGPSTLLGDLFADSGDSGETADRITAVMARLAAFDNGNAN